MNDARQSIPGYIFAYHCDGSIEQIRVSDTADTSAATGQQEEVHGKWADGVPAIQQLITFEENV